ncbi:MAG TPA: MFS transporter [Acidimicrobiales bacterium]|nr:MFS transporter [Acidimicrobiales bacterium]
MSRVQDPDLVHARRWAILGVLNLSLVIIVAGNASLNVALPTIVRDLHASSSQLEWMVAAYSLVFAGLVLPMGALGDRFGRKGLLQAGLATFLLGALGGSFATAPWHVIATRMVMGVGAAMIMPATLSIVTNVFPPHERSRAIAIWAGFAGAGICVGPLASGFLLDHFWFGSIFLLNVPIIAVALATGAAIVPSSRDPEHGTLDPVGGLLSMVGLAALLYAIIQAPDRGWTDPLILAGFVVAVVVLYGFVAWERCSDHPMLPIGQFHDRRFASGAGSIALTFFAMFGLFFVATQYLQFVLGYSPVTAGAATLPLAATMIVAAPRSAGLAERFGRNRVIAAGLGLIVVGMLVMAVLTVSSGYPPMALALLLFGAGMGLANAPATGAIMESMPFGKLGVGSAVNDTTREVGGSLGVAVLGSLLATGYRHHLAARLAGAPQPLAAAARQSLGGALQASRGQPGLLGAPLAQAARQAFVSGMGAVFLAGAAVAAGTAVLVLLAMPGRRLPRPESLPEETAGETPEVLPA